MLRELRVAPGRVLKATPVFDTYWRFAARRQEVFVRRAMGAPPPWTDDPVVAAHRFTNAYRAADRVSQYLIRNVIYDGDQGGEEVFFRTLLFKLFNRIETWEGLKASFGMPAWRTFDLERYGSALDALMFRGARVYSGAYIMPSPPFGNARKHRNHLALLEQMMRNRMPAQIEGARSLQAVFNALRSQPSFGDFLAFQFAIDLNYSEMLHFSEMEFVVAGPGARDGIRKCFADIADFDEADVIRVVADIAESEFARLGLEFKTLWGRPLQLIDIQNLFCEVDKYARVAHPEATGLTGRTRIKQKFVPRREPFVQWYPPKWGLTVPAVASAAWPQDRLRLRQAALPFALSLAG